jgi:prevent-host-death family protein
MDKIIGVAELQQKFQSVLNEVVHQRIPYILTQESRPEAVLLSYDQYIRLIRADEAGVLERFDALLNRMAAVNAQFSEDEVMADLEEATKIVRAQS